MYSPKIREDLIPRIYRVAKILGIAMTTWVNQVIEKELPEPMEIKDDQMIKSRKENRRHERKRAREAQATRS